MADNNTSLPCPGCGVHFPPSSGATHEYIGASAGCWSIYGEVLAREYSDMAYMRAHQYTVDAYTVQHPGQPERRSIQSVAIHLIALYTMLERGYSSSDTSRIRQLASEQQFRWLTPPSDMGQITVVDLYNANSAEEHNRVAKVWVEEVWRMWSPHHAQIRAWAAEIM